MRATHIPRRPKKKPLRGKKVGFAEKKLRLWGIEDIDTIDAIDTIEAIDTIDAIDAIEDMGFWGCGLGGMEEIKKSASPKKKPLRGKKSASPKINCAYSLQN